MGCWILDNMTGALRLLDTSSFTIVPTPRRLKWSREGAPTSAGSSSVSASVSLLHHVCETEIRRMRARKDIAVKFSCRFRSSSSALFPRNLKMKKGNPGIVSLLALQQQAQSKWRQISYVSLVSEITLLEDLHCVQLDRQAKLAALRNSC